MLFRICDGDFLAFADKFFALIVTVLPRMGQRHIFETNSRIIHQILLRTTVVNPVSVYGILPFGSFGFEIR